MIELLFVLGGDILVFLQKGGKWCRFEHQREIFLLNRLVLLRFLPLVEMTMSKRLPGIKSEDKDIESRIFARSSMIKIKPLVCTFCNSS
jgi:hypothetical protein